MSTRRRSTPSAQSASLRDIAGHDDLPADLEGSQRAAGESGDPVGHIHEADDDDPLAKPMRGPIGGATESHGTMGHIREVNNEDPPAELEGPSGGARDNVISSGHQADGVNWPHPVQPLHAASEAKEPIDDFGQEVSENAEVWCIYRNQATAADATMLGGWHKTLDVLLIFAGLFSAVSTAFLIESYKLLQQDNTDYVANALYVALTSASKTGFIGASVQLSPPGAGFTPHKSSRWINGLWFTSLVLSLAVSLLCILAKQWLDEYNMRVSAQAKDQRRWARRRSLFYHGLQQWQVPAVISLMPVTLHISLFLFFAGLVLFLQQLDSAIALCVLCLAGPLLVFYVLSNILPFAYTACPWSTSVVRQIRDLWKSLVLLVLTVMWDLFVHIRHWGPWTQRIYYGLATCVIQRRSPAGDLGPQGDGLLLDLLSLRWLIRECRSTKIIATAVQALGALPPWSTTMYTSIMTAREVLDFVPRIVAGLEPIDIARYTRTLLYL